MVRVPAATSGDVLLLLNGPPGVGKTTLARQLAEGRPMTLAVDVDGLRTAMAGRPPALARELALARCRTYLAVGYDVIVSQYVGRLPFIEALAEAAGDARFVEVILTAEPAVCAERFRARRRAGGEPHPADEVPDDQIDAVVAEAIGRLAEIAAARPGTIVLPAETAAAVLVRTLGTGPGTGSA